MAPPSGSLVHSLGHNTLGKTDIVIQSVLLLIVFVIIGLRFWSRRLQWASLQLNDLLIIVATVGFIRFIACFRRVALSVPCIISTGLTWNGKIVLDGRSLCGGNPLGHAVWNGSAFYRSRTSRRDGSFCDIQ